MCSGVLPRGSGVLQDATDVFLGHRFSRSMTRGARAVSTVVGGSSCTSHISHDSQAPWIVAFFILGICVAEGLISTSVVEQLVKPDGWSRASRAASSTASSGLSATWLPLRRRRPYVHLVCRGLRLCVAYLCRAGLGTSRLSLSGGICRDHHDVRHVGEYAVPDGETSTSRGGIPQEHPPRFRRPSGNHCCFSA
jgi:hypothetical protein